MLNLSNIDNLGTLAAEIAMRAAVNFLKQNCPMLMGTAKLSDDEIGALLNLIKQHAKAAVVEALADAKKAVEAGMLAAAEQTFKATMALAGIKAAKQFVGGVL